MKSTLFLIFIPLAVVLYFSSCSTIVEPTLERIEDVEIITMNKSTVELNANMVINNPNGFALDLDKADLVAMLDDVELAKINQTYETSMPAKGEFKMPIYINMDLNKLYNDNPLAALGKGIQIISDRKLEVQFKGTISVGKGMAKVSVPVDQLELVEF